MNAMNAMHNVINGTYRTNEAGETERKCPHCGAWANADHIDNGIGAERCGPYGCARCGWSEPRTSIKPLFR